MRTAETARRESPPLPPIDIGQQLGLDLTGLREALPYYKAGDLTQGDAQATRVTDPIVRTALEWVALRNSRDAGQDRFHAFLIAHPDWPARDFLVRRIETGFYQNHSDPVLIDNFFATRQPADCARQTGGGRAPCASRARTPKRRRWCAMSGAIPI